MGWRGLIVLVAVGLVGAACSDTTVGSPATAPPIASTQAPLTTVAATTAPSTTAPATTAPPTTVDRVAEIEAIFRDLEFRRLDALYRGDEEAFRALFANEGYGSEAAANVMGALSFIEDPQGAEIDTTVEDVLVDGPLCLAVRLDVDYRAVLGTDAIGASTTVLEPLGDGWGYSFVGDGWLCDGPHPFG